MATQTLGDFDLLKGRLHDDARLALRQFKPKYVAEFEATLASTGDLAAAIERAKPLLTSPLRKWPGVLTSFFDFEFVRGKVAQCHGHLKRARDSIEPDAGYWFAYHLDHWVFQTDSFLERSDTLYMKVIREVIRRSDPDWQLFSIDVAKSVAGLREEFGKVRHPLAHGLGGGVAGITEQWESILAAPTSVALSAEFVKESMGSFFGAVDVTTRRRWFRAVHRANLILFAYSEAYAGKILRRIESLDQPAPSGSPE